jgi:GT2 family glycosyltransferase
MTPFGEQSAPPSLSIVMATYNRGGLLARNLRTVLSQQLSAGSYEVVLVVDGSIDDTLELLAPFRSDPKLRVITQPNQGPAKSRQTALAHARGDIVLFNDDDIRFTPEVVRYHLEAHARNATPAMVRGSIRVAPESPSSLITEATRRWYEQHFADFRPEQTGARIPDDFLIFANTSVPRVCIERYGGIDPTIPFPQEGFELLLRLLKCGIPLQSEPRATVFEVYSKPTWKSIVADAGGRGRADWAVCIKHPDFRRQSIFGGLAEGGVVVRKLRGFAAHHSSLPSRAANALIWASEIRGGAPLMRTLGLRALALRNRVETLRGGISAAGSWATLEKTFGAHIPVLMYHHVGPQRPSSYRDLTIEPRQFEEQMEWLDRNG